MRGKSLIVEIMVRGELRTSLTFWMMLATPSLIKMAHYSWEAVEWLKELNQGEKNIMHVDPPNENSTVDRSWEDLYIE